MLAIYKDNFCDCSSEVCKNGANVKFKELFMLNLEKHENAIQDMISILMGSPKTEKQISILVFWIDKIHNDNFLSEQMDQLLDLFVVIYLKCTKSVQLTLVDDIDRMMVLIKDSQKSIFIEKKFAWKTVIHGLK